MDVLDDHARCYLALRVVGGPTGEAAWAAFEWAVLRYGLPAQVLSDNGTCFIGRFLGVKVEFERRLEALGISSSTPVPAILRPWASSSASTGR